MSSLHPHSTRAYFSNIAWSWLGVGSLVLTSALITPILIRRLGAAQFGIWALALSLIEYFWMIDLGFRPATVKLSAEFRALEQSEELAVLINTAVAYSVGASVLVLAVAWLIAGRLAVLLHVKGDEFAFLIRIVGVSWAGGLVTNIFAAALEGAQRFDLTNRAFIVATVLRGILSTAFVLHGYGLRQMGFSLLLAQAIGYAMTYFYFRRTHPGFRFSVALIQGTMARRILAYARQMLPGTLGMRFSQGALPSVIAIFRPIQFVTYFTQTQRMMDYTADAIGRVGLVTAPRASAWHAQGEAQRIIALTLSANRYCVTLWGLWASYLLVYGADLCRTWINQDFGNQAATLLPWFVVGYTLYMGQFVSAAVLMGIARYSAYGPTLLAEAFFSVGLAALLLPHFGITGAAASVCVSYILSRVFILSYLFCKEFRISQKRFLWNVYARPLTLISLASAALMLCHGFWPGKGWLPLIAVALIFSAVYAAVAFRLVASGEHRQFVFDKALENWRRW